MTRLIEQRSSEPGHRQIHKGSLPCHYAKPIDGQLSQELLTVGFMPPLPRIPGREVVRVQEKLGWATVSLHASEMVGPGLLQSILTHTGVTVAEFRTVI